MIHNKNNKLALVRAKSNIRVQDLATTLQLNPVDLVQMESGKQTPSLSVIVAYHLLFDASLETLFTDLFADIHSHLTERSIKLLEELKSSSSPKSQQIVQGLSKIVNLLNKDCYDSHN